MLQDFKTIFSKNKQISVDASTYTYADDFGQIVLALRRILWHLLFFVIIFLIGVENIAPFTSSKFNKISEAISSSNFLSIFYRHCFSNTTCLITTVAILPCLINVITFSIRLAGLELSFGKFLACFAKILPRQSGIRLNRVSPLFMW